jgi:type IV fimbrial biogenesis protein FimT
MYATKGYSLFEMLITIALVGILCLAGIPSWQYFMQENQMSAQVRTFITALNFARSEAVKQSEKIIFCPSENQHSCGGFWEQGQIVLSKDNVLRAYPALPPNVKLIWKSSLGRNDHLEFVPSGFTNGQKGSFIFCPPNPRYAKRIVIEQSGRMRITEEGIQCNPG